MGRLLSAAGRLLLGLIFVVVGAFAFSQLAWPHLIAFTYPETTVTVDGPCRDGLNESHQVCDASWTVDGAAVSGEISGEGLRQSTQVSARVNGDSAIVIPEPLTLALYCTPLLFILAGLWLPFSRRRGRWSSGDGDGGDWGDSGGDGGGDGGGGGD
ncbi:hypothetical protein ACIA8K_03980 [Catenuloplanes sp. NPDC051500]|uniref:hypothetical protein n=1 Tax=Catenuloplanes sp. NPDC051500 TaxID=3363959 RepID=UPI003795E624